MAFPHLTINTETVLLEKFFVGVQSRMPMRILQDLAKRHQDHVVRQGKLYTNLDPVTDEMLIAMRLYLFKGMHDEKEVLSVTYPATWFDHLKDAWLKSGVSWKAWAAGKLAPPKYTTEVRETKIIRVCPHNDTYFSDSDQHLYYLLWRYDENNGNRLE